MNFLLRFVDKVGLHFPQILGLHGHDTLQQNMHLPTVMQ